MLFQSVQIIYWIALSTWFGSVLFIALAAPIIFRTVEENKPILTNILSVNLEGQHGTLLAGTIVTNLIQRLLIVELICGSAMLLMLIIHPFVIDMSSDIHSPIANNAAAALFRSILFLAAAAIVIYDWQVIWPKITKHRNDYIEHADEPDIANPAKDHFDQEQRRSLTLLTALVAILLGIILFSSNITPPAKQSVPVEPAIAHVPPS